MLPARSSVTNGLKLLQDPRNLSATHVCEAILAQVTQFARGCPQADDLTLISARVSAGGADRILTEPGCGPHESGVSFPRWGHGTPGRAKRSAHRRRLPAGLVLLVAGTLGWLGWRLLSQEETLLRSVRRTASPNRRPMHSSPGSSAPLPIRNRGWDKSVRLYLLTPMGPPAGADAGDVFWAWRSHPAFRRPAVLPHVAPIGGHRFRGIPAVRTTRVSVTRSEWRGNPVDAARQPRQFARSRRSTASTGACAGQGRPHRAGARRRRLRDETLISPAEAPCSLLSRFARVQLLADSTARRGAH